MPRLARRTALLLTAYASLLLAVLIAGFLAAAIGIWASILWGLLILGGFALYARRRI